MPKFRHSFRRYNSIGQEELLAATKVISSGVLSSFVGSWNSDFFGGTQVRALEEEMQQYFGVKHAISVNSWTSGLIAAVGALALEPGDEVIVPTWTMSATATAVIVWNCVPVFADIDSESFCISSESVLRLITPRTRAIIAVDIFGQSAEIDILRSICKDHNLVLISDSAQAPNAKRKSGFAGSLADIGGISLNYHKHIHSGEGGVIFTNNDEFALRMRLIRNHGEVVVSEMPEHEKPRNCAGLIGYNFRLGEIEAAIAREQLRKLDNLTQNRAEVAKKLMVGLQGLTGMRLPTTTEHNSHVYYMFPIVLFGRALEVGREIICSNLEENGLFKVERGYQNLHLLQIYNSLNAYGNSGIPWSLDDYFKPSNYKVGSCPVAEELNNYSLFLLPLCAYELDSSDVNMVLTIFHTTWQQLGLK